MTFALGFIAGCFAGSLLGVLAAALAVAAADKRATTFHPDTTYPLDDLERWEAEMHEP